MKSKLSSNISFLLFLSFALVFFQVPKSFAAIPICPAAAPNNVLDESNDTVHSAEKKSIFAASEIEKPKTKKDKGTYGILALIFGLTGVFFPAAIALGIIGLKRHRKLKGLAIAGLVLGSLVLLYYLLPFVLFFVYLF